MEVIAGQAAICAVYDSGTNFRINKREEEWYMRTNVQLIGVFLSYTLIDLDEDDS